MLVTEMTLLLGDGLGISEAQGRNSTCCILGFEDLIRIGERALILLLPEKED